MAIALSIVVITVSDRAAGGVYPDRSGPGVEEVLRQALPTADLQREVVPDDPDSLRKAFQRHRECHFILTTGGTGLGPRDLTPETTELYCDRPIPGIAEMLRARSLQETPYAALSRGFAGQKEQTIIVNLPGSVRGAAACARAFVPIMEHAAAMIRGSGH